MAVNTADYAEYQSSRLDQPIETRVVLKVGGLEYNSWKSINIQRSITQIAGTFSFTTANRFAGDNAKWGITTGDVCTVEVAGETVITGYIDDIDDSYTLGSHDITFSGRDKTSDLVDCCFDIFENDNEFKNLTVLQLVKKYCGPFSIQVELDDSVSELSDKVPSSVIETGEFVFDSIATYGQQYGFLPIPNGLGKLVLTRAGTKTADDSLESGVNIKANTLNQSDKNRYSIYYVYGKAKPNVFNKKLVPNAKLPDEYIKRTRPLIVLVGDKADVDGICEKRVAWESAIRKGMSRKLDTLVKGWKQVNGGVWPLNGIVQVKDEKVGFKGKMLIAGLNLTLDGSGGELTRMALVYPGTFDLKPGVPLPNDKLTEIDKITVTEAPKKELTSQELKDKLNV